jgi:hypothetical protein
MSEVAITAVAQPLAMLTAAAAEAAAGEGCVDGNGRTVARGMKLVCGSMGAAGNEPVGWRRMMPVCCSEKSDGGVGAASGCRRMMRVSSDGGPPEVTGQPT